MWPNEQLGDLFDIGAGKSVTPGSRIGEGRHPFLRTSNVLWGKVDLSEVDAMHYSSSELLSKTLLPGDLLVCEGGEIGRAAIWRGEIEKCGFQNHLHRLRSKRADVLPCFFMYYLQAGFTQLGIYEGAGNRTTIPNLSRNRLAALDVPRPAKDEQEKIAAVLWKTQQAAELEEKLTATVRELKAVAMRRLFTNGLYGEPLKESVIGSIPVNWTISTVRDVAKLASGGTPSRAAAEYWKDGTVPWVKTGEVDYCVITDTEEKITPLALKNSAAKLFPKGTVLVAMYGQGVTRGKAALLGIEAATNQACVGLAPKTSELGAEFLYYYLGASYDALRNLAHGAQQQNLSLELVGNFPVPKPPVLEQQAIIKVLRSIDRKIAVHERRATTLRELFASLLHRLMTGEIRVDKLDIDVSEVRA